MPIITYLLPIIKRCVAGCFATMIDKKKYSLITTQERELTMDRDDTSATYESDSDHDDEEMIRHCQRDQCTIAKLFARQHHDAWKRLAFVSILLLTNAIVLTHRQSPLLRQAKSNSNLEQETGLNLEDPVNKNSDASNSHTESSFSSSPSAQQRPHSCTWAPEQDDECKHALQALVCPQRQEDRIPRLFFAGDSTMRKLVLKGRVLEVLQEAPRQVIQESNHGFSCRHTKSERCALNEFYGLPYRTNGVWLQPGELEGPLMHGLENPYCQDCRTCRTEMMICEPQEDSEHPLPLVDVSSMSPTDIQQWMYASYAGLEFTRDVEIQTDQYPTSQENIAHYLDENFNTPSILNTWEKPTCVINSGHHDVMIKGMTQDLYVENARWYLHVMEPVCHNIVWLSTNAPRSNDYAQKITQTLEWGHAVRDMLAADSILSDKSVYVDVYNASLTYEHNDNGTSLGNLSLGSHGNRNDILFLFSCRTSFSHFFCWFVCHWQFTWLPAGTAH